jgi:hypothetical protein
VSSWPGFNVASLNAKGDRIHRRARTVRHGGAAVGASRSHVTLKISTIGSFVEPKEVYVSSASRFAPFATDLHRWTGWDSARASAQGNVYDPPTDPDGDGRWSQGRLW